MFCAECGRQLSDLAVACPACGRRTGVALPSELPDTVRRYILPVGRPGLAIAAGYVALFAIVVFPLAPISLLLGLLAMRQIRRTPGALGTGRAVFAIIIGALWIVGFIALVAVGAALS